MCSSAVRGRAVGSPPGADVTTELSTVSFSNTTARRGARPRLHPVEQCVRWLLAALDRHDVPNVVLRGDRELPRLSACGELAVACAPHHADQLERMLQRAAARYGVQIVAHHRATFVRRFHLHGADAAQQHRLVNLELHTAETFRGVPILSARQLLQGRTRKRGHARPDVVVSALVDFLGPYLSSSAVRDEALSRLATVLEQCPAQTRGLLGDIFGTHVADELTAGLSAASRAKLFRCASRARRAVLWRAFMSAPLASLVHSITFGFGARLGPLPPELGGQPPAAEPAGVATLRHGSRREAA